MGSNIAPQDNEDDSNSSKNNNLPETQDLVFDEDSIFQKHVEEETKHFPNCKIQKVLVFKDCKEKEKEFKPSKIKESSKKVINLGQMTYEHFITKVLSKIDQNYKDSILPSIRNMKIKNGFYTDDDRFIFNFEYLPFKRMINSNEAIIHLTRYDNRLQCEYNIKGLTFYGHFISVIDFEFYNHKTITEYFYFYDKEIKWSQWKDLCIQTEIHPFDFKDSIVTVTNELSKCILKDEIFIDYKHFKLKFISHEIGRFFYFEIIPNNNEIEYGNIKFIYKLQRFILNFNGNFNQIEYLIPNNLSKDLKDLKQFKITGSLNVHKSNLILTATEYDASKVFKNDHFSYLMNHKGEHAIRYQYNDSFVNFPQYLNNIFYIDIITICEAHKIPIQKEFKKIEGFIFKESHYHSNIEIFELRGVVQFQTSKVFIFFFLNEPKFNLEIYIDYENIQLFPMYKIQCLQGDTYFRFK